MTSRLSDAASYYEEALASGDSDPLTLIALAGVRWHLGQADRARSCLAEAESGAKLSGESDALKLVATLRAAWAEHDRP